MIYLKTISRMQCWFHKKRWDWKNVDWDSIKECKGLNNICSRWSVRNLVENSWNCRENNWNEGNISIATDVTQENLQPLRSRLISWKPPQFPPQFLSPLWRMALVHHQLGNLIPEKLEERWQYDGAEEERNWPEGLPLRNKFFREQVGAKYSKLGSIQRTRGCRGGSTRCCAAGSVLMATDTQFWWIGHGSSSYPALRRNEICESSDTPTFHDERKCTDKQEDELEMLLRFVRTAILLMINI